LSPECISFWFVGLEQVGWTDTKTDPFPIWLAYFCLAELRRYVPHGFWRRGFVSIEMRADNARRSGSEEIADSQRAWLLGSAICHLQFAIFW
jgi:hypothetical protein